MRHGNTFEAGQVPVQVGARTDLPLTAQGRKQAETMAQYLLSERPKVIYAGSLKRQTESAQIIAQRFHLVVLHEPALTEIDYGAWEGLTAGEIASRWPKEHVAWAEGQWQTEIFGGTLEGHKRAIEEWLDRLRKQGDEPVIAITSNGLLRFFQNEKVKTGHFCEIELFEDGLKIQKWNIDPQYAEPSQNKMD